jgi:hypothetical protein
VNLQRESLFCDVREWVISAVLSARQPLPLFPPDSRRIAVSQQMTFRAQKQSRLFNYSLVDVPTGKISWKTAPCAYPGDADSDPP